MGIHNLQQKRLNLRLRLQINQDRVSYKKRIQKRKEKRKEKQIQGAPKSSGTTTFSVSMSNFHTLSLHLRDGLNTSQKMVGLLATTILAAICGGGKSKKIKYAASLVVKRHQPKQQLSPRSGPFWISQKKTASLRKP